MKWKELASYPASFAARRVERWGTPQVVNPTRQTGSDPENDSARNWFSASRYLGLLEIQSSKSRQEGKRGNGTQGLAIQALVHHSIPFIISCLWPSNNPISSTQYPTVLPPQKISFRIGTSIGIVVAPKNTT